VTKVKVPRKGYWRKIFGKSSFTSAGTTTVDKNDSIDRSPSSVREMTSAMNDLDSTGPFSGEQIKIMEDKFFVEMEKFAKIEKAILSKYGDVKEREDEVGSLIHENNAIIKEAKMLTRRDDRLDEERYFEVIQEANQRIEERERQNAKYQEVFSALKAEREMLEGELKIAKDKKWRELMEDQEVRCVRKVNGLTLKQHIDQFGNTGGLVGETAHVPPDAFVDIDSVVRGNGLRVESGVKIINSSIVLSPRIIERGARVEFSRYLTRGPITSTIKADVVNCSIRIEPGGSLNEKAEDNEIFVPTKLKTVPGSASYDRGKAVRAGWM
jgi:hypothetical protein